MSLKALAIFEEYKKHNLIPVPTSKAIEEAINELEKYESDMDIYLDYTTGSRCSKSFNADIAIVKQQHDRYIETSINKKTCKWAKNDEYDEGNIWHTDCKLDWYIPDSDTPKDHYMKYCPKCGGEIVIVEKE